MTMPYMVSTLLLFGNGRVIMHTILVVIITVGLYVVKGYSIHLPAIAQHTRYCDKDTDKYKCGPAVTVYADVTSTNAGLKSPTQLRTLPNTLLVRVHDHIVT